MTDIIASSGASVIMNSAAFNFPTFNEQHSCEPSFTSQVRRKQENTPKVAPSVQTRLRRHPLFHWARSQLTVMLDNLIRLNSKVASAYFVLMITQNLPSASPRRLQCVEHAAEIPVKCCPYLKGIHRNRWSYIMSPQHLSLMSWECDSSVRFKLCVWEFSWRVRQFYCTLARTETPKYQKRLPEFLSCVSLNAEISCS